MNQDRKWQNVHGLLVSLPLSDGTTAHAVIPKRAPELTHATSLYPGVAPNRRFSCRSNVWREYGLGEVPSEKTLQ